MYGMLLESIQHFVRALHGEDKWQQVLEHAGLRNMIFTTHKVYDDNIMIDIASSCACILQDASTDSYMHYFGTCFVNFFSHYGYDKILRVSGRHFRDFLNGIDNLHETMRFSYPRLQSPSFYVEHEDVRGCILNYRSKRLGFTQYVVGQLKQCAMKFYSVDLEVIVVEEQIVSNGIHVMYRLNFDNRAYDPPKEVCPSSAATMFSRIPGQIFFKVFPFSLVFNCSMVIQKIGPNLQMLFQDRTLVGSDVTNTFQLRRPVMEFTWKNILWLQKVVFELESLTQVRICSVTKEDRCVCVDRQPDHWEMALRTILLRGQMKYIDDWKSIVFLCTPLLGSLEDMEDLGLYINDLTLHDNSRDMVLAGWQHASQLEYSIDKQVVKGKQIADNLHKLDLWRQQSESLLYSMIPKTIAIRLKHGADPISTCETFEEVTIMFSYLIGFMEICLTVSAMKVVEVINQVFTLFDGVIDKYDVFKVETLGDAVYMVAGGVPDRSPNHAWNIAGLALELIEKAQLLTNPSTGEQLNIRVGMHTGGVVAGVVGKRMPQYCLFGDTVNTASRMQTNSEAGKIHISEPCHKCLKGTEFVTVFRGHVHIKGKGEMKTYWLAGRRADPNLEQICAAMKVQRNQHFIKQQKRQQCISTPTNHLTTDRSVENGFDFHGMHTSMSSLSLLPAVDPHCKEEDEEEDVVFTSPSTANSSGSATPRLPIRFGLGSATPSRPGTPAFILSPGEQLVTPEALQLALTSTSHLSSEASPTSSPTPSPHRSCSSDDFSHQASVVESICQSRSKGKSLSRALDPTELDSL